MSADKLVDSTQLDTDLTSVANAIRTKGGTSASLTFPSDFVSAINAISGGGASTLITKSITANGTYNASSDSADGYSQVTVNVPTGSGGLTFESGTYEPSADTTGEKILFANTHSEAPAFIMMVDATGTADTTANTNMQFVWYDYYKLYGTGMPWSSSAMRYASAYYAYRATNTSALSVGGVHCSANSDNAGSGGINYPRFWTDELGFTPNSASTSRYWRAGRTYKWYAIWRQT